MARSLFRDSLTDRRGNVLRNVTVTVYDEGTTTLISQDIFSIRTGSETKTNPFTITDGLVEFWIEETAERVDARYSGPGIVTKTVTLDGVSPDDLGSGGVTDHGALTGLDDDDHAAIYDTSADVDAKVATHSADTTSVHGVADTSLLATDAEVTTAVTNHEGAVNPHPTYETSAEAQAKVDAHTGDALDAHDASAISFVPIGTLAATSVQGAIEELDAEKLIKPILGDGSVLFAVGGQVTQDNAALFWDDTNNRLDIGPREAMTTSYTIGAYDTATPRFLLRETTNNLEAGMWVASSLFTVGSIQAFPLVFRTTSAERARINTSGDFLVGTTADLDTGVKLQVQGAASEKTAIFRANATTPGNIIEAQTSAAAIMGSLSAAGIFTIANKLYPGTPAAALQTACGIFAGTGAPIDANGSNGDIYLRSDGGNGTTIYQRRTGVWAELIATHEAAADPHPVYETSAEAQAKIDVHTSDTSDAHDASAISFIPVGSITATDVQGAIEELENETSEVLHARIDRTSGNLTLNSTTWANVDTGLDIVLDAAAGDWVEVGVSGQWQNQAVYGYLDVVSVVSANPVNSWADNAAPNNANDGFMGWYGETSRFEPFAGSVIRQLVAGDISGGTVTLRLRYRTNVATNKLMYASANDRLTFWARNHRQAA